jgi:hypothetical protein
VYGKQQNLTGFYHQQQVLYFLFSGSNDCLEGQSLLLKQEVFAQLPYSQTKQQTFV